MHRITFLLALCLCLLAVAQPQNPVPRDHQNEQHGADRQGERLHRAPRRGNGEGRLGVQPTKADIRYAEKRVELVADDSSSDRLLDVYLPKGERPEAGFPCVVFIHGGGFRNGDKFERGRLNPVCGKLLEHGYAIVSINYYLSQKYAKPGIKDMKKATVTAADDAVLALKWLVENAEKQSLDIKRLALCGGSAGAMTCLEVAYVKRPDNPKIRAVVDLWGLMEQPEKITENDPPMIIIHGDQDKTINISRGHAIKRELDKAKVKNKMIVMEGKGHAQYREVAEKYANDILEFLKENLKP